ncbi:MAG: carbon-nitrogen family hydrolase [Actinomycetota bacterium]|nr:carbon-nitrogen family hydrolase [Actinomycetota bacterium]
MKVALVQHDLTFEDAEATLAHLALLVDGAAAKDVELIVLTEMFATGFSMATERVAEPAGSGPGARFLADAAARTRATVAGSLPVLEPGSSRPVNRFLFVAPDGTVATYDKIHPFSYGGEDRHYEAGHKVTSLRVGGVALTPFVCYDLRFADVFWGAAERTDAYVLVTNWPASRQDHFRALAVARAIENQAYVLATNRVGSGGGIDYAGGTIAVDPFGEVLAEAGSVEETLIVDVDPARVAAVRDRYRFLADRR